MINMTTQECLDLIDKVNEKGKYDTDFKNDLPTCSKIAIDKHTLCNNKYKKLSDDFCCPIVFC